MLQINQHTMSSREIAELLGSRHDKVKQSIERLVLKGIISKPPLGDGIKSANGTVEQIYLICKRDSYVVVAQLSPEFTAKLVDRWQELEYGNNNLQERLAKVSELLAQIKTNGSLWGKVGSEQRKIKKEARKEFEVLINQIQLTLF